MIELGKRLKELRTAKSLTSAQLSQISGVARSLISQLETGKRQSTSIDTAYRLAKALEVPVSYLLDEDSGIYRTKPSTYPMIISEGEQAYLTTIRKAQIAGLTPELLDQLIDIIIQCRK